MREFGLILIFSLSFMSLFGQQTEKLRISSGQLQIANQRLSRDVDSLTRKLAENEKRLAKKIEDASQTMEYLNSVVNSFGQIFTVLGIFIGIVSLALPIVMYQFGIKPSRLALQELEDNIDRRLAMSLSDVRQREIDAAIENLELGNTELRNRAISYLSLTQYGGYSDQQLFRLYSLLKKQHNQPNIKSQIAYILSTKKSEYADDLFSGEILLKDPAIKQMAFLYFTNTGFKNYKKQLVLVLKTTDSGSEFLTFAYNLAQHSHSELLELLHDEELVNLASDVHGDDLFRNFESLVATYNVDRPAYEKTYFYTKLNKNNSPADI
ncbi:hypothetical protein [uncultured Chitinophaga sp.]|uniref:hypothetical protein n=1 Tax=uncultured Chitinophaga sp. TaxID=339340 RepID=UPI0025D81519|nr:hypothetical protein [uncultured Chitinophaga sp.]